MMPAPECSSTEVVISNGGSYLQANFSDGTVQQYADVDELIEHLYKLWIQPEQVKAIDWHDDIDRAPSSGTKIALFYGLRKKYGKPQIKEE